MVDPISDFLTRIRNAQAVGHKTVSVGFSKFKYNLAQLLVSEGFLEAVSQRGRKAAKVEQPSVETVPELTVNGRYLSDAPKHVPGKERRQMQQRCIYPWESQGH